MWPCIPQSCWAALLLQLSGQKPCASPICGQNEVLSLSLHYFAPNRVKEEPGKAQGEVNFFLSLHSARDKETAGKTKRVEGQETRWAKLFLLIQSFFEGTVILNGLRGIFFYCWSTNREQFCLTLGHSKQVRHLKKMNLSLTFWNQNSHGLQRIPICIFAFNLTTTAKPIGVIWLQIFSVLFNVCLVGMKSFPCSSAIILKLTCLHARCLSGCPTCAVCPDSASSAGTAEQSDTTSSKALALGLAHLSFVTASPKTFCS